MYNYIDALVASLSPSLAQLEEFEHCQAKQCLKLLKADDEFPPMEINYSGATATATATARRL